MMKIREGNIRRKFSHNEFNHQKDGVPLQSAVMPNRLFSSEAGEAEKEPADAETVKGLYDKILNCVAEKRTAPPNAWLWSLIAKCSIREDIKLLFDILPKLRTIDGEND